MLLVLTLLEVEVAVDQVGPLVMVVIHQAQLAEAVVLVVVKEEMVHLQVAVVLVEH
jgi:hypothetical protein